MRRTSALRRVAEAGLVAALTTVSAGVLAAPALAANYGNTVNNCYGIYWTRDWNQECGSGGADAAGNYATYADCTYTPGEEHIEKYRIVGSTESYDGDDCAYGIASLTTWFN